MKLSIAIALICESLAVTTVVPASEKRLPTYCGVHCLYAALRLLDVPVEIEALLNSRYITDTQGSSFADLSLATSDIGVHSKAYTGLTTFDLGGVPTPAILHVKRSLYSKAFDHFIVLHSIENGMARIIDPSKGLLEISLFELANRWDGSCLVIATQPIDTGRSRTRRIILLGLFVGACTFSLLLSSRSLSLLSTRSPQRKFILLSTDIMTFLCFMAISSAVGLTYQVISSTGLLRSGTSSVINPIGRNNVTIEIESARRFLASKQAVFIDARHRTDYDRGHIPGAINVPPTSSTDDVRQLLAGVPIDADLVVYCQSSRCSYAEIIEVELLRLGYSSVFHFTGGWVQWNAKELEEQR